MGESIIVYAVYIKSQKLKVSTRRGVNLLKQIKYTLFYIMSQNRQRGRDSSKSFSIQNFFRTLRTHLVIMFEF